MANDAIPNLNGNFNFLVELDGITVALVHKCSGFSSNVDVIECPVGGQLYPLKYPGMVHSTNIVLEWGMTTDMTLYQWHLTVVQGKIQRKNGSIILQDRAGNPVARWDFTQAWPSKCTYSDLSAGGNEIFFERLEIVCQTLTRVQ